MVRLISIVLMTTACDAGGDVPAAPSSVVAPVAATPVAHPVIPAVVGEPVDPRLTKPCGDACGMRIRGELEGWQVVELRWGTPGSRWNEPFSDRFELHLLSASGEWGPLLLRSRPAVTYVEPIGISTSAHDVDAGRLLVVEVQTHWEDALGGRQRTTEQVICKPPRCVRVQADSLYRSPEGSELIRHFDVEFEMSRLVVRSPDEARCGSPPPGAVRSEDEPRLLWFGNHPWVDVFD